MKKQNKKMQLHKKIIISLVCVILFNFSVPKKSDAATLTDFLDGLGGAVTGTINDVFSIAITPITTLAWVIEDTAMAIIQVIATGNFGVWSLLKPAVPATDDERKLASEKNLPVVVITDDYGAGNLIYPDIKLSPEEIFANKIPLLDINFISPNKTQKEMNDPNYTAYGHIAYMLRDTIRNWYNALKLIAIVGLLSVLIYIRNKINVKC